MNAILVYKWLLQSTSCCSSPAAGIDATLTKAVAEGKLEDSVTGG